MFLLAGFSIAGMAHAAPTTAVYTEDNATPINHVLQYQSGSNGALSLANTVSAQGAGTGAALASQSAVVLTQDGHWLVVVDAGSNQITVFKVSDDRSLVVADVVSSQGASPISLTVNENLVYVLNSGTPNIAGFSMDHNGQLTFIPGSIQPLSGASGSSPEQIGFSNNGNVLVVTEKAAGVIDTYSVGDDGLESAPNVTPSNGAGPYGFGFTSQGFLVLSEAAGNSLSSYAVSNDGTMRTISGALPDFGNAPCWVAVSHDGRFAYTSNAHGGTISAYSVSGQGTLSLVSSIAAKTSAPTLDLALNGNGHYLYALNGGHITSFQTYPDGGISQASTIAGVPASAAGLAAA
ncbi:MAG: lactonase family protein [Thaumarchaeota archaeon]|nr:lactonase family protein [Nitrososphaerota archaeon]